MGMRLGVGKALQMLIVFGTKLDFDNNSCKFIVNSPHLVTLVGLILAPGWILLSELDIRENLPIIADFWVKAIFPI